MNLILKSIFESRNMQKNKIQLKEFFFGGGELIHILVWQDDLLEFP